MSDLATLSDEALIEALHLAVRREATALVELLKHLAEFDRRKLGVKHTSSTFVYCTRELGFSEDEAYKRISAARAAERFPLIYQLLEQRHVHLTAVVRLAPHLTEENHRKLLWQVGGLSRTEIDALIACLDPQPRTPDVIRPLSATRAPAPSAPAAPRLELIPSPLEAAPPAAAAVPEPAEPPPIPDLVQFSFTGPGSLARKLERARQLLWHKHPFGGLAEIIDDALEALLDKKDPDRAIARAEARAARAAARKS